MLRVKPELSRTTANYVVDITFESDSPLRIELFPEPGAREVDSYHHDFKPWIDPMYEDWEHNIVNNELLLHIPYRVGYDSIKWCSYSFYAPNHCSNDATILIRISFRGKIYRGLVEQTERSLIVDFDFFLGEVEDQD